ncbi:hypothetical protein ACHAQH_003904 [Verticillium albo-atrum]
MYARGILFGKMKYELGDHSFVRCPELDLVADIEFKTKGWVGGTYNAIGGFIKRESTDEILYELSGLWSDEMYIKDVKTGHKEMFFNAKTSKPSSPSVRPVEEQEERESQRLWQATAQAVRERNHELATDEKTKVEDMQREEREIRNRDGVEWHPRLFRPVKGGPGGPEEGEEDLEWVINAVIDGETPEKQAEQVLAIYPILPGQKSSSANQIPPHKPAQSQPQASETVVPTAAAEAAPAPAAPAAPTNDLIDLSQPETAATTSQPAVAAEASPQATRHDSKDITGMLSQTGKPAADGPLIDFVGDLKKNVPELKRADTSEDDFQDAQEK